MILLIKAILGLAFFWTGNQVNKFHFEFEKGG